MNQKQNNDREFKEMDKIELIPIAFVSNDRDHLADDDWGEVVSEIILRENFSSELFKGLETFSHVEVIFVFHRIPADKKVPASRHPRNNKNWPKLGLLAQRSAHHPNPIGLCTARILDVKDSVLTVQGLDAVNGSPILDIKPVFHEFTPRDTKQPGWVSELLKDYWKTDS
ncbi:MAG: SAM-dependent methyltransferase [Candidatus Marinimicrobia bacterium]|jgi:tRNA-Thr(GGU) m(6)t(6)A37 methyltransferase TsaA|nr:SAM-dependent methyltransferase [Candidatus Neomarinimicrobiota bacterium]MBT3632156.1 SAM-dependent methyltransferase [Candidatus Neomarinimicrobiota bacterium]MBT3824286.1 SAM-dependent methyltransferase [Candidatus Neomarinimicrobiota bacterium]MBT4129107.1 SAM-dependent methyltransferase [Candidatus Neomarinimicrobiota bacterium]MBT4295660.1 SAM-dependent methyltransferase [Candidatus Neomarinimicrobiota bacterium]